MDHQVLIFLIIVRLAEVDCTIHKEVCTKYGIKGYPTVNFFSKDKSEPTKYSSARTKEAMVTWLNEQVPSAEKPAEDNEGQAVEVVPEAEGYKQEGNLYILTEETFKMAVE